MISTNPFSPSLLDFQMGYSPSPDNDNDAGACVLKRKLDSSSSSTSATKTTKEPTLKKSRRTGGKTGGVRFHPHPQTIEYHYVSKLDLKQAWLQKADIEVIKEGIRDTIRAIKAVNGKIHELDETNHCIRGIETGLSPIMGHLKKQWVQSTQKQVLDEQRRLRSQKKTEQQQEDHLSVISRECSQEAVWWANQMATWDTAANASK